MYAHYLNQEFNIAIDLCEKLTDAFAGKMKGYYAMWIERCEFQLTQDLPADWNGVTVAQSK